MSLLQNIMERLRPMVGVKSWDYCVLWKLSEDQRFLEWMDCCCGGTENFQNNGEELLFPVSSVLPCRDVMFQHSITKACELLAQLPSSMPLNSEIHSQALISNKPRWLNYSNGSNSNSSDETFGTRVLIPVPVGLIELFVDRQVSEDQRMIDFITSQFNISLEQQHIIDTSTADSSFMVNVNPIKENDQKDSDDLFQPPFSPATMMENLNLQDNISLNQNRSCSFPMNFLQQFNYPTENNIGTNNDEIFLENTNESSFRVENPMNPFKSSGENGFQQQIEVNNNCGNMQMHIMEPLLVNKKRQGNDKDSMNRSDSVSDCSDPNDEEDDAKYRRRNGKGPQSKNLVAERKRRKKLNDRLYSLRALVPKISKLDRASILGDAIEFVMELQKQARDLQNELEDQHSDDEGNNNLTNVQPELLHGNGELSNVTTHMGASIFTCGGGIDISIQNQDAEITSEKVQMEPQVEVAQLDGNEFFVKVFCEQKAGGFVKLMEALNSLGLEVTNVNVTSYRRLILNVFKVEKRDSEMVQADHVRDSLLELTRNPSRGWPEMAKASENGIDNDHHLHHRHHHPHVHAHQMKTQLRHHHHLHHLHN